jgi:hypothetical protein
MFVEYILSQNSCFKGGALALLDLFFVLLLFQEYSVLMWRAIVRDVE